MRLVRVVALLMLVDGRELRVAERYGRGATTPAQRNDVPQRSRADITARGPFAFSCAPKSGGAASHSKSRYYNTEPGLGLDRVQESDTASIPGALGQRREIRKQRRDVLGAPGRSDAEVVGC